MTRSTSNPQLDLVDLTINSRNTLAVLIKLLAPHVPYSVHILGAILNTGPRASTLQDIDPSKVSLWSTISLDSDVISTTGFPTLFSIVTFSHLNHQFSVFCSSDSSASTDLPTEVEKTHIKYIFEYIRDMARKTRPMYDSVLFPRGSTALAHPPMIVVGAVHPKWAEVLAPMSWCQSPNVRYAFPRGAIARRDVALRVRGGEVFEEMEMEISEIQAPDLPFVHGASTVPRSDAYLLSRAPYSVCVRARKDAVMRADGSSELGRTVACALMHADGSIGALRVDVEHQRRGLGRLVLHALVEKLDFTRDLEGDPGMSVDGHLDLGGGALGWYWMDTGIHNGEGNHFFTSVLGKESSRPCHWTYIQLD